MKLPDYVKRILERLDGAGIEAWVVGGAVRDFLMGLRPRDYDIAAAAHPRRIIAALDGYRLLFHGLKHGTVTVAGDGGLCEVTAMRAEGPYTDRRRPDSVSFGVTAEQDLARRDFTVNAAAWSPRRGLYDPFCARLDIDARLIRCVGDPRARFEEDALRLLRALRFAARLDFAVEEATAAAMSEKYELLDAVAAERITDELREFLSFPRVGALAARFSGLLGYALGLDADRLRAAAGTLDGAADPIVRLALLSHLAGGDAAARLRLTGDERRRIRLMLKYAQAPLPDGRAGMLRLMRDTGPDGAADILAFWAAAGRRTDRAADLYGQVLAGNDCYTLKMLDFSGADAARLCPGPGAGALLRALLDDVIDGRLPNEHAALARRAQTLADGGANGGSGGADGVSGGAKDGG